MLKRLKLKHLVFFMLTLGATSQLSAQPVKKLVFEEKMIEGKIRRPQLVLIKADTRPEFEPMVMKSVEKGMNVEEYTSGESVEGSHFTAPFEMENYKITNYKQ